MSNETETTETKQPTFSKVKIASMNFFNELSSLEDWAEIRAELDSGVTDEFEGYVKAFGTAKRNVPLETRLENLTEQRNAIYANAKGQNYWTEEVQAQNEELTAQILSVKAAIKRRDAKEAETESESATA